MYACLRFLPQMPEVTRGRCLQDVCVHQLFVVVATCYCRTRERVWRGKAGAQHPGGLPCLADVPGGTGLGGMGRGGAGNSDGKHFVTPR